MDSRSSSAIDTLLSLSSVAVIAHRGGSKLQPENTLAAFDHAASLGVAGFECDVHVSSDGEVVVIHDPTLERTTDATGPVGARTAAELAAVDAGFRFAADRGFPARGQGMGVPRLAELLDRHPTMPIVVEMKGDDPRLASRTVAVVREANAGARVVLAGFSGAVLREARRLAPGIPSSASMDEVRAAVMRAHFWLRPKPDGYRVFQVPMRLRGRNVLTAGFVRAARAAAVPVHAWVIDEPTDMHRLVDWGVTGLISDRPDLALSLHKASPGVDLRD